ncbi:hypothetical protein GQ54DRAFT_332418 [Martensiomyces pterosporus]|nr:hypothetical protein GQ54DRAFT_332418 [Martensiomyces pterosporus]
MSAAPKLLQVVRLLSHSAKFATPATARMAACASARHISTFRQQDTGDFQVISSTGSLIQDGDEFHIGLFEEYGSIATHEGLIGGDYTYTYANDEDETTFSKELPKREFRIRIAQDRRFKSIMSLATWDGDERFGIKLFFGNVPVMMQQMSWYPLAYPELEMRRCPCERQSDSVPVESLAHFLEPTVDDLPPPKPPYIAHPKVRNDQQVGKESSTIALVVRRRRMRSSMLLNSLGQLFIQPQCTGKFSIATISRAMVQRGLTFGPGLQIKISAFATVNNHLIENGVPVCYCYIPMTGVQ